ncbi:hypothetical protein [Dactylosporangium salmoneum]|uniref:Head fiber protein n=1 Tax=Dactylosporangium salmoneum TaxID=53361 RepID=A0ABN3G9H0_9ACTN
MPGPKRIAYAGDIALGSAQVVAQTADLGALTSTVAAGANPTKAEYDALRVDVQANRTKINALLAALRTAGILAP